VAKPLLLRMSTPAPKPGPQRPPEPVEPEAPPKRGPSVRVGEHRIAVASISFVIGYDSGRTEQLELRGAGIVNANDFDGGLRTTGVVSLASRSGVKRKNTVAYNPGALDRNLVFTLFADDADFDLLRALFITSAGGKSGGEPGLTLWVRTAKPFSREGAEEQQVSGFGYRLEFALSSGGLR